MVGGGGWLISAKWTIPEFPDIFPGIALVSIIYTRYCHKIWGSSVNKIGNDLVFQQVLINIWGIYTYSMLKCCDTWIMPFHKLKRMGGAN